MKKRLNLLAVLLFSIYSNSQAQMDYWFIAPKKVEVKTTTVLVNPIVGTPDTASQVANGVYDNANNLLFYVADTKVYDYNNSVLGSINNGSSEVIIVPFGDNDNPSSPTYCNRKFNIFSVLGGGNSPTNLYQSVLDMNSFSLAPPIQIASVLLGASGSEYGAIAVGTSNATTLDRYMYFLAGSGSSIGAGMIFKLILHNDGTVSSPTIIFPTLNVPCLYSGANVFARELDLSPDGHWLAWASYINGNSNNGNPTWNKYHYLALDNNGDVDFTQYPYAAPLGPYQEFNIPGAQYNANVSGFRGLEFYQKNNTTKLFVGAGDDGIYPFDITIPFNTGQNPTKVIGSNNDFGFSQIELAKNGLMYASSGVNNMVGALDPLDPFPLMLPLNYSFLFTSPPKVDYTMAPNLLSTLYTLPDQIDGQTYAAITPPAAPLVVTTDVLYFPANASTNQTATWVYSNNPVNNSATPIYIIKELHVRQNSHLIISGMEFRFSPDAKVIVEQGSSLTLESGSKFTSTSPNEICSINKYTWQGVEVWGNSTLSQNAPLTQGKLVVKENSIIEHARWGARAWKPIIPEPITYTTTGGIIQVYDGGTFKNCNVDVEFKPYQYKVGTKNYGNKSYFKDAIFINNDNYYFSTPPQHVVMEGCSGIQFSGCTFQNHNSQIMFNKQSLGIKSLNSSFTVSNNSSFKNLYHGIDVKRTTGAKTFRVINSRFEDNQTGIYAENISNLAIQQNAFIIGGNLMSGATTQVGVNTTNCSGFSIEENNISSSNPLAPTVSVWGVITNSCGGAPNQIYKNTFADINIGNFSVGINRDNTKPTLSGLEYLCNGNSQNNNYDFLISNKGGGNTGVRLYQGSASSPAQNTFSHTGPVGSSSDFNNGTSAAINYYYKNPNAPTFFNSPNVVPTQTTASNSCPSNLDGSLNQLSDEEIISLTNTYDTAETAYLNLLYSYNQLMDGGSTNALLNQIQQSWSNDALTLRDELMVNSPFLSREVLREVALNNILPPAMFLMVCLANPDATKDEAFLNFLQNEIQNPLPSYMISLIVASWDNATTRTTLENLLADYNKQMSVTSNKLLADIYYKNALVVDSIHLADTTNYAQQINYWLNRIQTPSAKYDLIENYFESNMFDQANQILTSIPIDFSLSADQVRDYNDYVYFYNFRSEITSNGSSLAHLDSTQVQTLINFVQVDDINFAKGLAQNALCFYYGICRVDDYSIGNGNRMSQFGNAPTSFNANQLVSGVKATVTVIPNPATYATTFNYSLTKIAGVAILSICDITGKEIVQFKLLNNYGQINWDTSLINNGLYYYSISAENKVLTSGKVSVKK